MLGFKYYDYDQNVMVEINFELQLVSNTPEFTLHQLLVHNIDLSGLYHKYNNDDDLFIIHTINNHFICLLQEHHVES